MAVTRLEITARAPYQGGMTFGEVGAYEQIDGLIHFAVDPLHPANAAIIDLDKAARDDAGHVTFSADFSPLAARRSRAGEPAADLRYSQPGQPACGAALQPCAARSRAIDGGSIPAMAFSSAGAGASPAAVGSGMSSAAMRCSVSMRRRRSAATVRRWPGPSASGSSRIRASGTNCSRTGCTSPTTPPTLDQPDALLRVRDWPDGPPTVIPRDRWRFARDEDGTPVPDDGYIWMAEGFTPGKVYEVIYRTRRCPVVGAGMLAVRDCVSFLRAQRRGGQPVRGPDRHDDCLRRLAERALPAPLPLHRPQSGRVGAAGLRRPADPRRGGAARRVQPSLRPALRPASAEFRPPPAVRRRSADGPDQRDRRRACSTASAPSAACRRFSTPTPPPSTGAAIPR